MSEEEEAEYGLLMPFVTVSSKGGPHDDVAYTAGWEMGSLDARLEYEKPAVLELTINAANAPQADLLAMKHGYVGVTTESEVDGWSFLVLTRIATEAA
jgi:hypothetical protein